MIPSLLVVGAGPLQLPAIHEARALGIRSIAVDGNASAAGLALCDVPYVADILDADAVSAIAREREYRWGYDLVHGRARCLRSLKSAGAWASLCCRPRRQRARPISA